MIKIRGNIILLGTSHVSKQSQKQIKDVIEKYSPKVVGIELDYGRFKSLMSNSKSKKNPSFFQLVNQFGGSGAIFALIAGHFQNKIGKKLNIEPGIDMKTAYLISRENKIPTSLIDLNIKTTMRKISKLSFLKKFMMFSKLILKSFDKKYRNKFKFNIKTGVPEEHILLELLKLVKKEIPLFYNILIEDRNKFMVKKLLKLKTLHPDGYILAVVGAGHVDGMAKILDKHFQKENSHIVVDRKFTVNLS